MNQEKYNQLKEIHNLATKIMASDINWEIKFDLIFSVDVSLAVRELIDLDYVDPDTSYEEDVQAYMSAFNEKMVELEKVFG